MPRLFSKPTKAKLYAVRRPVFMSAPSPGAAALVLLWAALGGFALLLHSLLGGAGWWLAWLAGAGMLLALWALRRFRARWFGTGCLLALVGDALLFLWQGPALRRQMLAAGLALLGQAESSADGAILALALCYSLALLLGAVELGTGRHSPAAALLLALLCLLPLLGAQPGLGCVLLLGVYALAYPATDRPKRRTIPSRSRICNACAAVAAALFLLAGVGGLALSGSVAEPLFSASYALEGAVRRTATRLSGVDQALNATGVLNRGNLYPTGAEHLRLWIDEVPAEPLYLKGFAGGDYTGRGWDPASEDRDMDQVTEALGWDRWGYMVDDLYQSMYFMLQYLSQEDREQNAHLLYLHTASSGLLFAPYWSRWAGEMLLGEENWYSYLYYTAGEMQIDWDAIPSARQELGNWYASVRQTYSQIAAETYTRLPETGLTRLRALVAANPQPDAEAVTAFIASFLHSQAIYTTTPGFTPLSEDYAEYFLFTSHQGYCQQFATAATLLYRLYGIPARYVTSYAVQPSDFVPDEEGGYSASITDASAHAWVEIWLDDTGWTPVEMTPAGPGSTAPDEAMSGPLADVLRQAAAQAMPVTLPAGAAPAAPDYTAVQPAFRLPSLSGGNALGHLGAILATPAAAALLLAPLLPDGVRALRRRRLARRGPAALAAHLVRLLRRLGLLPAGDAPGGDGLDALPAALAALLPGLAPAEAACLAALARRAAYGSPDRAPTPAETAWALRFCRKTELALALTLTGRPRACLRWSGLY